MIDPPIQVIVSTARRAAVFAVVAAAIPALACHPDPARRIDALLAPLASDRAPGVAVMVIHNGTVLHAAGVGLADVERGTRIGRRTVFDIASCSKQFTAMLAMILHEEGRLDYDAPVVHFLPELS